jgi:hypothetical protein
VLGFPVCVLGGGGAKKSATSFGRGVTLGVEEGSRQRNPQDVHKVFRVSSSLECGRLVSMIQRWGSGFSAVGCLINRTRSPQSYVFTLASERLATPYVKDLF